MITKVAFQHPRYRSKVALEKLVARTEEGTRSIYVVYVKQGVKKMARGEWTCASSAKKCLRRDLVDLVRKQESWRSCSFD